MYLTTDCWMPLIWFTKLPRVAPILPATVVKSFTVSLTVLPKLVVVVPTFLNPTPMLVKNLRIESMTFLTGWNMSLILSASLSPFELFLIESAIPSMNRVTGAKKLRSFIRIPAVASATIFLIPCTRPTAKPATATPIPARVWRIPLSSKSTSSSFFSGFSGAPGAAGDSPFASLRASSASSLASLREPRNSSSKSPMFLATSAVLSTILPCLR